VKNARPAPYLVRFESFELNLRSGELRKEGKKINLPEQSFQILAMLLERPQEVIMRGEIQKRLWPNDTVVEFENSIHAAVRRLRLALGDPVDEPRYIATLARRGYRWMFPAEGTEIVFDSSPTGNASPPVESSTANLIGKKVAHYRVLQVLGGGGMGIVYAAEDLKLGRRVALKFLPEELTNDSAAMQRFEREARAASALNHPNICTIYGVEEHEGHPFIAMEMLEGQTLRELIAATGGRNNNERNAPLHLQTVLDIGVQIARGLDAAHKKGIIHRDIKPANVFITSHGAAKILDFGLAKQQGSDWDLASPAGANPQQDTNVNVTLTGATVGTAGYMSPEQIRGEKLDARTDLFSFGLVLYEMAVGQRAFTGNTAAIIHDATLHHEPLALRTLNSKIPARLQGIIDKTLQKDRAARYQSARDIRNDVELLRREIQPGYSRRWRAVSLALAALFIAGLFLWIFKPKAANPTVPAEIKLRQLTANSFENHVISGAISLDGRYLAYSDIKGLHVKIIDSGETRDLAQPEPLRGQPVEWNCVGWFPDNKEILAAAHPPGTGPDWYSRGASVWTISTVGGAARMLRDNADAYAVSPNGSLISFGTTKGKFGDREIWLMGPNGEQPHKIYETEEDRAIGQSGWSPDGTRIIFPQIDEAGVALVTRDLKGSPPVIAFTASEMQGINSFLWLPDSRFVYSMPEPGAISSTFNFWMTRLDEQGKPIEKPRRLTNLTGFGMSPTSVSEDGRHLAFLQWAYHTTVYVADLQSDGSRIGNARHFTLTESQDIAADWTVDGKAIILLSNRNGHAGIYRQSPDNDSPELLVDGLYGLSSPRVSPDGKWIYYVSGARPGGTPELKRVPVGGGASEHIFPVKAGSVPLCSRAPSNLCVIAEPSDDSRRFSLTAFDPAIGRGLELIGLTLKLGADSPETDLSPDGKRFAVVTSPDGPISLFSSDGQPMGTIRLGLNRIQFIHWAARGRGIYVTTGEEGGRVLWYVDLQGRAKRIWKNRGGNWALGIASPDGRYLAIESSDESQNVWLMENF